MKSREQFLIKKFQAGITIIKSLPNNLKESDFDRVTDFIISLEYEKYYLYIKSIYPYLIDENEIQIDIDFYNGYEVHVVFGERNHIHYCIYEYIIDNNKILLIDDDYCYDIDQLIEGLQKYLC